MLFLVTIIYSMIQYTYQRYMNGYMCVKSYFYYLFMMNKYILHWSIETKKVDIDITTANKVIVMFNHPKVLDGIFVYKYLLERFPDHTVLFMVKKELTNLPLVGNFFKENCICLKRNIKEDEKNIKETVNRFMLHNNKLVVAIFPEGTTFCKESAERSIKWCNSSNIQPYNNVLCPRKSGIKLLQKIINPDLIMNNTMYYLDDIHHNKTDYEIELLNLNTIHRCKIIEDTVDPSINFNKELYNLWRDKDRLLKCEYDILENIYNIIDKYYDIHPNIIKKSYLYFQTTKLLILSIPIALYCYGILYTLTGIVVFITSYLYHIHSKLKIVDMLSSSILVILSYYHMTNPLSIILMTSGIVSYFIGYICYVYLNMVNVSTLFHNLLHILCIMHIIVEFIFMFL